MSVARPSQCIFCTFTRSIRIPKPARRKLHTTPVSRQQKDQSESSELLKETRKSKATKKDKWAKKYSPEQLAAISAASEAIPDDKLQDGKTTVRVDPWAIKYSDDYSQINPVTDKPVKAPWSNIDSKQRMKDTDEITDDFYNLMKSLPENGKPPEDFFEKFDQNLRLTVGREEAERNPVSATAPEIPRIDNELDSKKKRARPGQAKQPQSGLEDTPALVRLMQMTGFSKQELAQLRVKTVFSNSVVNQTRMGKINKIFVMSVAGNGKGLLGIGEGKSIEGSDARLQSQYRAIRNMKPILRYEGRTIYGDVKGKVAAVELELYARPPGFGLRCQQYIWEMCKCAGISDLAARVGRSRNPMNTMKAAYEALLSQKDPEDIALGRGRKMVDVRKVYYAGQV